MGVFGSRGTKKKGCKGKAKKKATRAVMNLINFCMLVVNETNPLNNTNSTYDDLWDDVNGACGNLTGEYEKMKANASTPAYKKKPGNGGKNAPGEIQFEKNCKALERAKLFEAAALVEMKKPKKTKKPDVVKVLADSIALFETPCDDLNAIKSPV